MVPLVEPAVPVIDSAPPAVVTPAADEADAEDEAGKKQPARKPARGAKRPAG